MAQTMDDSTFESKAHTCFSEYMRFRLHHLLVVILHTVGLVEVFLYISSRVHSNKRIGFLQISTASAPSGHIVNKACETLALDVLKAFDPLNRIEYLGRFLFLKFYKACSYLVLEVVYMVRNIKNYFVTVSIFKYKRQIDAVNHASKPLLISSAQSVRSTEARC